MDEHDNVESLHQERVVFRLSYELMLFLALVLFGAFVDARTIQVEERPKQETTTEAATSDGIVVELNREGGLAWSGEAIERDEMIRRLAADPNIKVHLAPEENGPVQAYFSLEIACREAGVWKQVEVLYRLPDGGAK